RYAAGERVLLFLEKNDRGDFVAKNMTVGKFAFRRDARGRRLLVRDAGEVVGWDLDGAPHRERTRDADGFLTFIRATARGEEASGDYFVRDPLPLVTNAVSAAAVPIASYLLQSDGSQGTLGIRWNIFPSPVVFLTHGSQPGATNGGLTSVQRAFAAWTNDAGSNIVYVAGGTTTIGQTGFNSGNSDGVNTIQFNDPANEIPGAFTGRSGDTLAIGGAWFGVSSISSTHVFGGERFYTIQEADLVIQNGITGAGLTGNGLDHVVTHELGHTLGLRHSDEPPAGGTSTSFAIMNSSVAFNSDTIGSTLQAWDQEAIAAVYGSGAQACQAPQITQQPASVSLGTSSVTLSVVATGSSPVQYQWYTGPKGNTASPISGANAAQLTVRPAATTSYWVRVSNGCSPAADSDAAIVTVNNCPIVTISNLSPDAHIIEGLSTTLFVGASGGTLSYQWYLGATGSTTSPIANARSATLDVKPATTSTYWVNVTNDCGASAASATITVTVTPCTPPRINVQPTGGAVVAGRVGNLFVSNTGTAPLLYTWYQGESGDTSHPFGGGGGPSLSVGGVTTATSYWVRISNDCGSVDSAAARFTVAAACTQPVITQQPASTSVTPGASAVLSVTATGASLTYQWYAGQVFDFTSPIGGSASSVLTPPITTTSSFWVRITSPCGLVNST
ncbi:MAG TPA: M57 family metalloprotease, partial [Thermoanaerobaculia bacterium]|nr:M57 family metalloprotease [Thermoanaerobaculia bacterium]